MIKSSSVVFFPSPDPDQFEIAANNQDKNMFLFKVAL